MAKSSTRKKRGTAMHKAPGVALSPEKRDATVRRLLIRGTRLEKKGDPKTAAQLYLKAFDLDPRNPETLRLLGMTLHKLGKRSLAIDAFERALKHSHNDINILISLGNMALEMSLPDLALKFSQVLIGKYPESHIGYNNAATALRELERFDEAIDILQAVMPKFAHAAELWNTLATVVTARDGLQASLVFYEEAIRLNPHMTKTLSNLARAYDHLGRYEEAIEIAERTLKIDPEFTEARYTLGNACLALGNLERGWHNYEIRLHAGRTDATIYTHGIDKWDGSDLSGKRLLISPEQGVGDEIMFASFIPDVYAKAEQLLIGCDWRLVPLYERSFPGSIVGRYVDFRHDGTRHRHFPWLEGAGVTPDFSIEVGSLGKFLRPTRDSFPQRPDGYLMPDAERVAAWRDRLAALGDGLKIGMCWRSGVLDHERKREYTSIEQWAPLFAVPGVQFVNLQYDECAKEVALARDRFGVTIHEWEDLDRRNDLDEITALTKALDLVISPPTAPGMTAVSVGKEWWCLVRIPPWWCFGGTDTPLHAGARICQIPKDGDWKELMEIMAADLTQRAEAVIATP